MPGRREGLNPTTRLLPGEQDDVLSSYHEDAAHWRRVYEELLTAKIGIIADLADSIARLESSAAKRELEATDLRLLEAQAERYETRHSFWRNREWQLQGKAIAAARRPRPRDPDGHNQPVASGEESSGSRGTVLALIPGFLDGEDPESTDLLDASKWLGVYQRLVNLETEVLDRMLELASRLDETSKRAVELSNIKPVKELIELFQQRTVYWQSCVNGAGVS
jgi:hypothetical protein